MIIKRRKKRKNMNKNKFLKITNTLIINFSEIRINSSNNRNKINNIIRH